MKMRIKAITAIFLAAASVGCAANEKVLNSGGGATPAATRGANLAAVAATPKTSYDEDLASVKMADFIFLYILRRKDGGVLDAQDKAVIKQSTDGANRRVSTDEEKAFIIGSNLPIESAKLKALFDRFAVQDLSKPEAANINANLKRAAGPKAGNGNTKPANGAVQIAD